MSLPARPRRPAVSVRRRRARGSVSSQLGRTQAVDAEHSNPPLLPVATAGLPAPRILRLLGLSVSPAPAIRHGPRAAPCRARDAQPGGNTPQAAHVVT